MKALPLLQMRNISKHYQMGDVTIRALKGVNLEIEAGVFMSFAGPSGSGKSFWTSTMRHRKSEQTQPV